MGSSSSYMFCLSYLQRVFYGPQITRMGLPGMFVSGAPFHDNMFFYIFFFWGGGGGGGGVNLFTFK